VGRWCPAARKVMLPAQLVRPAGARVTDAFRVLDYAQATFRNLS
jgi:hypothetical protein